MLLAAIQGCDNMPAVHEFLGQKDKAYIYADYAPVKMVIMPLTEVVGIEEAEDSEDASKIKVYVGEILHK